MPLHKTRILLLIGAILLPSRPARADYFLIYSTYPSTLDDRANSLSAPPGNDFDFEIDRLVEKPPSSLVPVEGADEEARRFHNVVHTVGTYSYTVPEAVTKDVIAREKFEQAHLSPAQLVALKAARDATSADEAYAAGEGLPLMLRAYTAGAVAFENDDYQGALTRFTVAEAADNAEPAYKVWVTYMLGRTAAKLDKHDDAQKAFATVREMVTAGAPDPLGLAVASYGEEARLALDQAGGVLGEKDFDPDKPGRRQNFLKATRLYALQAEAGSQNGHDSLHILAKDIKNVPSDFRLMMQDELTRRLFLAYARGYSGAYRVYGRNVPGEGIETRQEFLTALLPLFPADDKEIADQLAAAAYEIGNSDLAHRYTQQKPGAYSTWVEAKLALRAGDRQQAASLYDQAYQQKQQETDPPSIDPDNEMMAHERAILTLVRGQYVKAFEETYTLDPGQSDASYLAERILTLDEVKDFIDHHAPDATAEGPASAESLPQNAERFSAAAISAETLRTEFAERLLRVGKLHEALPYFSKNFRPTATEYVKWLDQANSAKDAVSKAEGFYRAAAIERESGETLFGETLVNLEAPDTDQTDNTFVTQGERDRLASSRAESTLPPSYRQIATDEAIQAADLLPPKSQAFAATLCHATTWIRPRDEDKADSFYQRYVKQGAIVPWATHFGHNCPDPDFNAARHFQLKHYWNRIRHELHRRSVIGVLAIVVVLGVGGVAYRQRRRKPTLG